MKKKMSIRNKAIIYFSVIIIITIVSQLIFNLFLLKPFVSYTKTKIIENSFYDLKDEYGGSVDDISTLADDIQNKHGIKTVLYSDNEIIFTTGFSSQQEFDIPFERKPPQQPEDNKNRFGKNDRYGEFINNPDDFKETPSVNILDLRNDFSQLVLKGKFSYNGKTVFVVMTLPMESIDTEVYLYNNVSYGIMFFALVIAVVMAIGFSASLAKPITAIEKVAQNLSNLDFSVLADENVSAKEISSLAKSINSMSAELQNSINDLQAANKELKKDIVNKNKIEEMRRQFIANVSHEMKTPLGLLQIYCENLKNNVEGIDKEYYCNVIIEETQNLNEMVKSMLDISSIESGLTGMTFEKFDISKLCEDIALKFKNAYDEFDFDYHIEDGICLSGDAKYITQAINNYVSNAVSHTDAGNTIELKLAKDGNHARLSVYNEGSNVDENSLDSLWDPFFKSDKARTRNENNNVGLGLYIVKTTIEKHNGAVYVENKQKGVEFGFLLPIE